MLSFAGELLAIFGLVLLGILMAVGTWVLVNEMIKAGLKVYKDCLDLRADIRNHEGRKKS